MQLTWNGEPLPASREVLFLEPGEELRLEVLLPEEAASVAQSASETQSAPVTLEAQERLAVRWMVDKGRAAKDGTRGLFYQATQPGAVATITVDVAQLQEGAAEQRGSRTLHLVVGMPANEDGSVAGSLIGYYPNENGRNVPGAVASQRERYRPPQVFYPLDPAIRGLHLAEGARVEDFFPLMFPNEHSATMRYVAWDERLLTFWRSLREVLKEQGQDPAGLRILRGFVTPTERQRLDRMGVPMVEFTRHLYGDAVDVILDRDGDCRMDDLNKDGQVDAADARVLADAVEQAMRKVENYGGIGVAASYPGPNHIGTPYADVDLRGTLLRWEE